MKRCLLFISLLLFLFQTPCLSKDYQLRMQVRGHDITGICMMDQSADDGIVGTVVNEFGMKAFDFIYDNKKVQLLNIVAFLDKWYIRKVLRKDLAFILSQMEQGVDFKKKSRSIQFKPDGEIEAVNSRYKIYYTFTPMISEQ
ncbi:MAG: hypothetical protein J5931_02335 [Prevotella sp.]|nr:hypothetical protein [Prevotella sp.]MBQ8990691.1 hypothetical protein [Prevotella sp.]